MPRPRALRALACLGLALLPLLTGFTGGQPASAQGVPLYTVTDLGAFGPGALLNLDLSGIRSLTDEGDMAISYPDQVGDHFGYVTIGSQTTPLPIDLPNRVNDINGGVAVGRISQPTDGSAPDFAAYRGFVYQDGVVSELPPLEGGTATGAFAVNDRGVVVGNSDVEGGSLAPGDRQRGVSWKDGNVTSLGTLGGEWSVAYDINDDGAIIGVSTVEGDEDAVHPYIYRSRKDVTDLGTIGGSCFYRFWINASGQAAGACALEPRDFNPSVNDDEIHAVFWDGEELVDLGTLPAATDSNVAGLNDDGTVIGYALVPTGERDDAQETEIVESRAVVWVDGTCYDLNAQIDPSLGITLDAATAINGQGQIAVIGSYAGAEQRSIFLLTPIV